MMDQDHLDTCVQAVANGLSAGDETVFTAEMLNMPKDGVFRIELPSGMTVTATRDGDFRVYAPTTVRPVELSEEVRDKLLTGLPDAEMRDVVNQITHAIWDHAIAFSVRTATHWYWIKNGQIAGSIAN